MMRDREQIGGQGMEPRIQDAMSELLSALGFGQMAKDVLTETEQGRLERYAKLIIREIRDGAKREAVQSRFEAVGLMPRRGFYAAALRGRA